MALLSKSNENLMTGEELLRRPDLNPCELVNGRVIPLSPAGDEHGAIEVELSTRLLQYGKESQRGRTVGGEVGIYIRRNPDTVRGADIAFISTERDVHPKAKGFFEVAPELVVEILSPEDRPGKVKEKLRDYFSVDVRVVWLVDPALRRVTVYRSLTDMTTLQSQVLTCEDLLPGFSVPVSEIFSS